MIDAIVGWLESIPWDSALWVVVLIFIALDVLVGTVQAILTKTVSSEKARKGVLHKMGFITAMLICTFIDIAQQIADIGYSVPVLGFCAVMIIVCEIFSLCEHAKEMNPDIKLDFLHIKDNEDE